MTSERRFEQDLPDLLAQVGLGPTPDYRDFVVQQTARMSQRPAWTFPERWLPMTALTQAVAPPRFPWRYAAIGALLILALVGAALLAGSVVPHVPAPFGPAKNGLIAYDDGGDIYTVDPVTGSSTAIVRGPTTDAAPVWSLDGMHLAFRRSEINISGLHLYVAKADGRDLRQVAPEPIDATSTYAFSPDGREIAYTLGSDSGRALWIAPTNGDGAPRRLDLGTTVGLFSYLPPDGTEIVFTDGGTPETGSAIYAIDVASGHVRRILAAIPGVGRDVLAVSPDGTRLAFATAATDTTRNTYMVHVVGIEGSNEVTLPMPPGATFEDAPVWSNDGTRLAVTRGYDTRDQDMALAAVPADGSSPGVETDHGLTGCCETTSEWSPDDSFVLTEPVFDSNKAEQQLLWDPNTGVVTHPTWLGKSKPAWQRRGP
jgi:Tol biopolymer transport system component